MTLPDGYSNVPSGKIAAVVTHLEMTARPPRRDDPPGAWSLRKIEQPALDWYRELHRRVGDEWLWFRALHGDARSVRDSRAPVGARRHDGLHRRGQRRAVGDYRSRQGHNHLRRL